MRTLWLALLFWIAPIFADYSIVYIHIGPEAPSYVKDAICQARLFNPKARIIFLSSDQALSPFREVAEEKKIELCSYEHLPTSALHESYEARNVLHEDFWHYTSERFLYLWDLMQAYELDRVFHLENDNMLYADLEAMLEDFQEKYPRLAATFDNEERCIPGFVWIANREAMEDLAAYFVEVAPLGLTDMYVIGRYRLEHPSRIDTLPIIMPEYSLSYPLESPFHHTTDRPQSYFNHASTFQAIFDAAAIGQFLGGIAPVHANNEPGFINESCLFNPSLLDYQWLADDQGRRVPYGVFQGHFYKIINLHVHSKKLYLFKS